MDDEQMKRIENRLTKLEGHDDYMDRIISEISTTNTTLRHVLLGHPETKQTGLLRKFEEMTETMKVAKTQITFYAGALSVLVIVGPILIVFILQK